MVDPCLRCYTGAFFMCNSNENLKDKGAGNGTQCRVLSVKLKRNQTSHMWKMWNNRKVWTVCASDVEWVEFEHFPKTQEIDTLDAHLKRKRQAHLEMQQEWIPLTLPAPRQDWIRPSSHGGSS